MSDHEDFQRVADQLSAVLCKIDEVDLNPLIAADVRTVLDARDDLQEVCLDCRQHQRASEGDS
jgi:hypothetical protein